MEVGGRFEDALHGEGVLLFVALGPGNLDGGAFADVEHAYLDGGAVGVAGHFAAESVDLTHDVTLGGAADGRVAGHEGDGVEVHGEEEGAVAHARGGQGGFAACVACADDYYVVGFCIGFCWGECHEFILPSGAIGGVAKMGISVSEDPPPAPPTRGRGALS